MRIRFFSLALLLALWGVPAFAQGCAMCYSSAAGSTKDGQKAISRGVLILLLPPVGFMTVGAGLAVRYGKRRDDAYRNTDDSEG
jgi:hypothetical protein